MNVVVEFTGSEEPIFGKQSRNWLRVAVIALAILATWLSGVHHSSALAAPPQPNRYSRHEPTSGTYREALGRLVLLRDYNTRVVLAGTFVMGVSSGVVGVFLLMRKRALLGDVVSHAALPGIAIAFLVMSASGGNGKWLPGLLLGAALSGVAGVLSTSAIRRWSRIKDDAALAVVLSVFFGLGVALRSVIQRLSQGSQAGLDHFIYGKAASMTAGDVWLIASAAAVALVICLLLMKEFSVMAFDERFASTEGWPVFGLDLLLMTLVVLVTVVGLQSVGLLLVVALLIVPPAAARFWTERLSIMVWIAGALGGFSALIGVAISAIFPRTATGAVIVLVGFALFLLSMFFGTKRGVARRVFNLWQIRAHAAQQHLLRAMYEVITSEHDGKTAGELTNAVVTEQQLQPIRSWTAAELRRLLKWAERQGYVEKREQAYALTSAGIDMAARIVRNHRLWELYLIHFADIAPSHVDRDADDIEHVLDAEMIAMLEARLGADFPETPPSPHALSGPRAPELPSGSAP